MTDRRQPQPVALTNAQCEWQYSTKNDTSVTYSLIALQPGPCRLGCVWVHHYPKIARGAQIFKAARLF